MVKEEYVFILFCSIFAFVMIFILYMSDIEVGETIRRNGPNALLIIHSLIIGTSLKLLFRKNKLEQKK